MHDSSKSSCQHIVPERHVQRAIVSSARGATIRPARQGGLTAESSVHPCGMSANEPHAHAALPCACKPACEAKKSLGVFCK